MKRITANANTWYKVRTTPKTPAQLWMMRNELTNITTIRLCAADGKTLDIDLTDENVLLLAELATYYAGKVTQ